MTSLVYSNSNSMTMALSLVLFIWMMATLPGFECSPFDSRIMGEPAKDGEHFFLGAFGWFQKDKSHPEAGFHFKCSVIVINQKTVLTHAQKECYRVKDGQSDYTPSLYAVSVGNRKRPNTDGWLDEENSRGGQGFLIEKIYPHPCFKEGVKGNPHNIAILKLEKFIRFTGTGGVLTVYPLVLPMYGWDKSQAIGHLKTNIIPYDECRKKSVGGWDKEYINENSFCTKEENKGACLFDETWMHVTQYQCTNSNGDCSEPPTSTGAYDPSSTRFPVTNWTITADPSLPSDVTATTGPDGNTLPTFSTTNEPTDKTTGGGEIPVPAGRAGHMEIPIFGIFAVTSAVIISNNNY